MLRFFRDDAEPYCLWVMWGETGGYYFGVNHYYHMTTYSIAELTHDRIEITYAEARAILADRPQELREEFERIVREHGNYPETPDSSPVPESQKVNRYRRPIGRSDNTIDVYDVLRAFGVSCPARQHCLKKVLMAGQRGAKSTIQDLEEAKAAIVRAIEMESK